MRIRQRLIPCVCCAVFYPQQQQQQQQRVTDLSGVIDEIEGSAEQRRSDSLDANRVLQLVLLIAVVDDGCTANHQQECNTRPVCRLTAQSTHGGSTSNVSMTQPVR